MAKTRRKALGRGLDVLLGPGAESLTGGAAGAGAGTGAARGAGAAAGEGRLEIPVERIRSGPHQPRRQFDPEALDELARSIRAHGVVQPVLVRPAGKDRYELVAGERRWRAAQAAGLDKVPAVVREVTDEAALAIAIVENIQREDLTPLEEARGLARLIEEFEMTHQAVARAVGRSRPAVSNLLRLLELEAEVGRLLEAGELEMGHARTLLGLAGRAQVDAARQVAEQGLTVRQTEDLVRSIQEKGEAAGALGKRAGRGQGGAPDPDLARLETRLGDLIGAEVSIRHGKRGAGRLTIRYHSLDELDGLLARLHPEFADED